VGVNLGDTKMVVPGLHLKDLPKCIVGFHIIALFLNSTTFLTSNTHPYLDDALVVVPDGEDNLAC
jgi:hypothetical protein